MMISTVFAVLFSFLKIYNNLV